MNQLYVAVDGDNVGSRLEHFTIKNDTIALEKFSLLFNETMAWFEQELILRFDAKVYFYGGDNLLASLDLDKFSLQGLEELRLFFEDRCGCTLSIGVGKSPRKAYLALKLAKTNGKNAVRQYEELSDG